MSSRILRLAMLSVGFGAAIPAIAADSKSTVASLEDIVVTATKREERLMDVPASLVAETGSFQATCRMSGLTVSGLLI